MENILWYSQATTSTPKLRRNTAFNLGRNAQSLDHGSTLKCYACCSKKSVVAGYQRRICDLVKLDTIQGFGTKVPREVQGQACQLWMGVWGSDVSSPTVASPASGHVGTCPLAFERIFFARLYVETSCLVWFGTMPNSNSALFVQPYSLWNDAL